MGVTAWLFFSSAVLGFVLVMVAYALFHAFGLGRPPATRRSAIIRAALRESFKKDRVLLVGGLMGMLVMNTLFALWPPPKFSTMGAMSFADQGRMLVSLALYLLCLAGWCTALWRAFGAIRRRLRGEP